jgi:hypothetical protein
LTELRLVRIGRPLLKLPIRFCEETLAREASALPANAWVEHPQKFDGNIAVPLVSPGGTITDAASGPMGATNWLRQCRYVQEVMLAIDSTWGRSRLMGLETGAVVPEHVDVHYYWRTHFRLHIPVITNPEVAFTCAGETVHMQAGECWLLDSFFQHSVANRGDETRIHLVLDTVGSGPFWDLIDAALSGSATETFVAPGETPSRPLAFEQINSPLVMSPWEMKTHVAYISEWTDPQPGRDDVLKIIDRFVMAWEGTWARYGISDEGLGFYAMHLNGMHRALNSYDGPSVHMRNTVALTDAIVGFILANALAPAVIERLQARSRQNSSVRLTA